MTPWLNGAAGRKKIHLEHREVSARGRPMADATKPTVPDTASNAPDAQATHALFPLARHRGERIVRNGVVSRPPLQQEARADAPDVTD